jgi:hypothetical protein
MRARILAQLVLGKDPVAKFPYQEGGQKGKIRQQVHEVRGTGCDVRDHDVISLESEKTAENSTFTSLHTGVQEKSASEGGNTARVQT